MDGKAWSPCVSPKRFSGLKEGLHRFRVRARKAGALDPSPAVRAFTVETAKPAPTILSSPASVATSLPTEPPVPEVPITKTLETARAAAELYFPTAVKLDVPASCGSATAVDCPGGVPVPPADQLSITSIRSVVEGAGVYPLTVTSGVETLQPIKATIPLVGVCDLKLTSANGPLPTWRIDTGLVFLKDPTSGEYRIDLSTLTLSEFTEEDFTLSGSFSCTLAEFGSGFITALMGDQFLSMLDAHFEQVGRPMCAVPGPAYLGPCP